jgi:ligand-binding sensor domain-containing protein/serine phosphatase RsbU (regulator of sigma subunit)
MMQIKNVWLLFLFALCSASAQQYNFRQYNVQDGLAHSQVSTILQDSRGYMWFATYGGGLSRFDGKTFVNFSEKDGLPCNIIRPMIQANDGKLWLGTMGAGLCWFDGKKFGVLKDSVTKINEKIYTLVQSKNGTLWFGADNGIYSYDGKHVKHFTEKDGFPEVPVMSVFEDSHGVIWSALWEHGIFSCDENGKNVRNYTEKDGLTWHTQMCFNEDQEGNLWIAGFKGMCEGVRGPGGNIVQIESGFFDDVDNGLTYMTLDDKKGNLWFATTDHGIIRYNKKKQKYDRINSEHGLPGDVIVTLMMDHEGNLWASTWGMGVVMFQGERFVHYTQKDGLGSEVVTHVIKDKKGGMIINTGEGIYHYDEGRIRPYDKQLEKFKALSIAMDDNGVLWLGDKNALYSYTSNKLVKYSRDDGLNAVPATSILCEGKNVWVGSWSGGLARFDGSVFRNFSATDGLSSPYIYTIVKSKNGGIYVGTWDGGLDVYDGKKFTVYKKEQGLPSNNVISIVESKDHIWLGTFGGGVCRFDGKRVLATDEGLSDDAIVAMAVDKNDDLYIAGSKGLNKLRKENFSLKGIGPSDLSFYGAADGFSGIECTHNATLCDDEGYVWFGTKKGLTRYDPSIDSANVSSAWTYITDVRLFFERPDWKKYTDRVDSVSGLPVDPVMDYRSNQITFTFITISTSSPQNVRYSYMLKGADLDYGPPTDKNEVTYSGLSPGDYTFILGKGKQHLEFHFRIQPPFWRRNWFYALCIIVAIVIIVLYTKWQTKKLAKENRILEEKVTERTSEIEKQKGEIEQKNRDITDSINYAKRIQYTLLANEELLKENLKQHFIFFQPKDIVSGDFYWATKKKDRFYLAVCDSTGHGVPGAFMSLMNISFLNEAIAEKNIVEPNEILNYVRQRLIGSVSKDGAQDGMDGILLCIDQQTGKITYAAGQNRSAVIRNNSVVQLETDKMPIGKGEQSASFRLFELEMKSADTLYLYTDGYADQFGGKNGKKFKYKQLQELLLRHNGKPMDEQRAIFERAINEWKGSLEQIDDILLIGIRI